MTLSEFKTIKEGDCVMIVDSWFPEDDGLRGLVFKINKNGCIGCIVNNELYYRNYDYLEKITPMKCPEYLKLQ